MPPSVDEKICGCDSNSVLETFWLRGCAHAVSTGHRMPRHHKSAFLPGGVLGTLETIKDYHSEGITFGLTGPGLNSGKKKRSSAARTLGTRISSAVGSATTAVRNMYKAPAPVQPRRAPPAAIPNKRAASTRADAAMDALGDWEHEEHRAPAAKRSRGRDTPLVLPAAPASWTARNSRAQGAEYSSRRSAPWNAPPPPRRAPPPPRRAPPPPPPPRRAALPRAARRPAARDAGGSAAAPLSIDSSDDDGGDGAPAVPAAAAGARRSTRVTRSRPAAADGTPVLQYPPGSDAVDSVVLTAGDVERLRPDEFLNDNLVDFYLKVLVGDAARSPLRGAGAAAEDVHAFSSHFFTKLRETRASSEEGRARAHARVERWTRGVDVFAKKFLLVPIVEHLHWSLAVVCHPGELARAASARASGGEPDASRPRPCIVFMDSLRMHSAAKIASMLRSFLEREWAARKPEAAPLALSARKPPDLPLISPRVPVQTNSCDCGVYVLRYAQEFLASDPTFDQGAVDAKFAGFDAWFHPADIDVMRTDIAALVRDLAAEAAAAGARP